MVEQSMNRQRRHPSITGHMAALLDPLRQAERKTIREALRSNQGNRSRTAMDLGIHRSTLIRKLKQYGIQ